MWSRLRKLKERLIHGLPDTLHVRALALPYGLLLPALLVVLSLIAYPLYIALSLSLREDQFVTLDQIGQLRLTLENFATVLSSSGTWRSLWLSLVYTIGVTIPAFLIGLGTALLLNRQFPARRWLRTLILLPWAVPNVIAGIAFLWVLDSSYGVANYLLRGAGLISENIAWFFNPDTAMVAVILPTVWQGYPLFTLTLLAALQSVPKELYEAAKVDGASAHSQFRFITWPAIRTPAILTYTLTALWVFREFDFIYALTGGGPNGATETLAILIYNEAFKFFHFGTAAALGMITLALCALLVLSVSSKMMKQEFF